MLMQAAIFLLLNLIIGFIGDFGLSKYGVISIPKDIYPTRMLGIDLGNMVSVFFTDIGPFFGLALLAFFLYRSTSGDSSWWIWKYIFRTGILLSYMLVAVHWGLESNTMAIPVMFKDIGRNIFPRMVYALGFGLLILLAFAQMIGWNKRTADDAKNISTATSVMLSAWGPTILILLGRQGPFIALVSLFGGMLLSLLNLSCAVLYNIPLNCVCQCMVRLHLCIIPTLYKGGITVLMPTTMSMCRHIYGH